MRRAFGTAGGGVVLIAAGLTFDATPAFVPGLGLLMLGTLLPLAAWLSARRARVTIAPEYDRVLEGEPIRLRIRVRIGLLARGATELIDPLSGRAVRLAGGDLHVETALERRGRHRLPGPRLRIRDPLGLVEIWPSTGTTGPEVTVLPRTEPLSWLGAEGRSGAEALGRSGADPRGASEVDGLRTYRPGTPASRIHWAALARGAGLLERRLIADEGRLPLVVLDSASPGPGELFDAAVRAAASLVLELARRGGCELVLPGARRAWHVGADLAGWTDAHVRLALVGDSGPPVDLSREASRGPVFWVTARPRAAAQPIPAGRGSAAAVLVVPDALAGSVNGTPLFSVAGCRGFALAPRAWGRRAA